MRRLKWKNTFFLKAQKIQGDNQCVSLYWDSRVRKRQIGGKKNTWLFQTVGLCTIRESDLWVHFHALVITDILYSWSEWHESLDGQLRSLTGRLQTIPASNCPQPTLGSEGPCAVEITVAVKDPKHWERKGFQNHAFRNHNAQKARASQLSAEGNHLPSASL